MAHRAIDGGSVVVDAGGRVWLLDWNAGETISNELSRRVDLAQTLALITTELSRYAAGLFAGTVETISCMSPSK